MTVRGLQVGRQLKVLTLSGRGGEAVGSIAVPRYEHAAGFLAAVVTLPCCIGQAVIALLARVLILSLVAIAVVQRLGPGVQSRRADNLGADCSGSTIVTGSQVHVGWAGITNGDLHVRAGLVSATVS